MKKRKYTREFKLEILRELESKRLVEVCKDHDVNPNVVSRWKGEYKTNPQRAFSGNGNLWKDDAKIAHYERLIGRQCAEIDFLKKTLDTLQKRREEERMWSK